MNHAELCPVCEGAGNIPHNFIAYDYHFTSFTKPCHGCGGRGWVVVPDDYITPWTDGGDEYESW
jgi:DnaJ-class molecular chaperone